MTVYNASIIGLWILFIGYWLVMATRAKKSVRTGTWWRGILFRLGIVAIVVLLVKLTGARSLPGIVPADLVVNSVALGLAGMAVCLLGMGIAVWARVTLGRNWGMPMSRKDDPELVTGGPYAYVRHPIYTGYLIAMLGSAIGESLMWILPLLVVTPYFIYSARTEEKLMLEQFPDRYAAYMQRTRMLLPWLL